MVHQYFSYIVAVSFIGGESWSTGEKTTDLPQVTDRLYYLMLYRSKINTSPMWSKIHFVTTQNYEYCICAKYHKYFFYEPSFCWIKMSFDGRKHIIIRYFI